MLKRPDKEDKKEQLQSLICSYWAFVTKGEKRIYDKKQAFRPFCECRRQEKQDILLVHLQGTNSQFPFISFISSAYLYNFGWKRKFNLF